VNFRLKIAPSIATIVIGLLFTSSLCRAEERLLFKISDAAGHAVPDAVVFVKVPASAHASPVSKPSRKKVVDQKNKTFVPHVSVISPGTLVQFPNSDDTRHHVYSFSKAKSFELQLYRANDAPPVTFDREGIVALGCNIHDNMKAYIYVTRNPYWGISDASGIAEVTVPAVSEKAQLTIWHPQMTTTLEQDYPAPPSRDAIKIALPITWVRPQQGRDVNELESLLKSFKN
jgi:plastocyanin